MTAPTSLTQDGTTAILTPLGWGAVEVQTTTGESIGVVEVAAGGRRARPACGCAPLLTATVVEAALWLHQHHHQHQQQHEGDATMSETTPAEEQVPTDTTAPDRRALTRHRWWVAFWAVAAAASLTFGTWSIVHEVTVHNAQVRDSCLAMIADAATPDPTFWRWVEVTSPLPRSCARFVGQQ